MSQAEIIEQLQSENGQLREKNAHLRAENQGLHRLVEQLSTQVHDLKGRVEMDSHNSSKPPSPDGYAKKTRSLRQKSGKKPGAPLLSCQEALVLLRERWHMEMLDKL